MYIEKNLTLKYTIQTSNLCNSYIFSNMKLTHNFLILTTLIVITMNNKEKMEKPRERCIVLVIISATEQGLLLLYSFDTLPSPKPNVLNPHSLLQGLTANNLSLSLSLSLSNPWPPFSQPSSSPPHPQLQLPFPH